MYREIKEYLQTEGLTVNVDGDRLICSDDETRVMFSFKDICSVYYFYEHTPVASSSVSESGLIDDWKMLYLAAKAKAKDEQFTDFLRQRQLLAEAEQHGAFH
ncbi:hypothetical protein EDC56_0528 [Sinobacterium caligoides]|uniref:Uncharacterized protein n=1 Tax=Sinobacterium caligoides TaxID=933926 RepID=A0A3N2DZY9_9GAMM|nr:hypothetical protein [Sinobacterium caligoides]ROS05009.1 hypothetical protein EDC56_0528 [Sinobacterium caligoides]